MRRCTRVAFLLATALAGAARAATLRVALTPPRDPEGLLWRL